MGWFESMVWVLVLAACLVIAFVPSGSDWRSLRGNRLGRRYHLAVPPAEVDAFDARLDRRRRRRWLCAAAAVVVAAVVSAVLQALPGHAGDLTTSTLMVMALGAAWLGAAWAELDASRPHPLPARAARLRAISLHDFVHPVLRLLFAGVAVGGIALAVLAERTADADHVAEIALVAPAMFAVSEVLARVVASRRQLVGSADQLYVADALRSESLSDLYLDGLSFAAYAILFALTLVPSHHGGGISPTAALLSAACLRMGIRALPGLSYTRFRARLWPDLGEKTVVAATSTAA